VGGRRSKEIPGIARLGPDALAVSQEEFAKLLSTTSQRLKTAITEQMLIAGIGNAYSDEILHTAKLSPFATTNKLNTEQVSTLYRVMRETLQDAVDRSVGQDAARLKGEKRSGMQVHARTGLPCPVCGDTVREVSFRRQVVPVLPDLPDRRKILADRRIVPPAEIAVRVW